MRSSSPTTPIDRALHQAAAAAPDAATRDWLLQLLQRGAAADGAVESTTTRPVEVIVAALPCLKEGVGR